MIDIVKNIKSGVVEVEITEEWGTGEGVQINSGEKSISNKNLSCSIKIKNINQYIQHISTAQSLLDELKKELNLLSNFKFEIE